jgi:hypothetical protein
VSELLPWRASGTYLESCNCEAICPCRTIGGRGGGRSTYGLCLGALSWRIEEGHAGETDLGGLSVILASRYHDDEPGSPWSFVLYLDEHADDRQREALTQVYTGKLGGTPLKQFPWAWKDSFLLAVRRAAIEIDHTPGRGWFRADGRVDVRIREPVSDQETVTCVIPGHHQQGREVYAEALAVHDEGPLDFEFSGNCGYEAARFAYSSDDD